MSRLIYQRPTGSQWTVREGDTVTSGQIIAIGRERAHSAGTGVIERLDDSELRIRVTQDDQAATMAPLEIGDANTLARIESAGIVGLGGGGFPTHLKLLDALRNGVERLVINAVECEPGISCDAALCEKEPETIVFGIRALSALLGAEVHIAYSNSTSACPVEKNWHGHNVGPASTPIGHERYLINTLFGSGIARGERPIHYGTVVVNVGTSHAVGRAMQGWPLIGRMVTVGDRNQWLPIGKPLSDLGLTGDLMSGGRLSGRGADPAVRKTTNAVHAKLPRTPTPCINCSACDEVCPEGLPVAQIVRAGATGDEVLERLHADRCIECGLCTPVCPSQIDVLANTRYARARTNQYLLSERKKIQALQRFEAHEKRRIKRQADKAERRQARLRRVRGKT